MTDEPRDPVLAARRAFDEVFALPAATRSREREGLLVIRVGAARFALRANALATVESGRPIVPVPHARRPFIGVAAVHGAPVAVCSLGLVLGEAQSAPAWLAVTAADPGVALAFDGLDAYATRRPDELHPMDDADGRPVRHVVAIDDGLCAVLDVAAILSRITGHES